MRTIRAICFSEEDKEIIQRYWSLIDDISDETDLDHDEINDIIIHSLDMNNEISSLEISY